MPARNATAAHNKRAQGDPCSKLFVSCHYTGSSRVTRCSCYLKAHMGLRTRVSLILTTLYTSNWAKLCKAS